MVVLSMMKENVKSLDFVSTVPSCYGGAVSHKLNKIISRANKKGLEGMISYTISDPYIVKKRNHPDAPIVENKVDKTTPTYTKDWYIKWVSTIILLFGIILTANNIYPYNLYVNVVALFGWIIVSIMWNDRALIVINVVGFTIYLNGIISYLVK